MSEYSLSVVLLNVREPFLNDNLKSSCPNHKDVQMIQNSWPFYEPTIGYLYSLYSKGMRWETYWLLVISSTRSHMACVVSFPAKKSRCNCLCYVVVLYVRQAVNSTAPQDITAEALLICASTQPGVWLYGPHGRHGHFCNLQLPFKLLRTSLWSGRIDKTVILAFASHLTGKLVRQPKSAAWIR